MLSSKDRAGDRKSEKIMLARSDAEGAFRVRSCKSHEAYSFF
jgi:hypothetical protein